MRIRILVACAAMAAFVLAVPGTSLATHDTATDSNCNYALGGPGTIKNDAEGQVVVYTGTGTSGAAGTTAAGVCVNRPTTTQGGQFDGGTAEVGTNGTQAYGVIDGDNANVDPLDGYVGLSNFETGTARDPSTCTAPNGADPPPPPDPQPTPSTNSGGCLYEKNTGTGRPLPRTAPTPICGNTSGNSWDATGRDGCEFPP